MNFNGLRSYSNDYGSIAQHKAVTILFAEYLNKLAANGEKSKPLAIVRGIEKDPRFLMTLQPNNQDLLNNEQTKTDPEITILKIEVPTSNMLCPRFMSYTRGQINLEEYESSLFLLDVSGMNLKRIPRAHEVIQIKYENITTPQFDGYPTDKIMLDPFLAAYSGKNTRDYFE